MFGFSDYITRTTVQLSRKHPRASPHTPSTTGPQEHVLVGRKKGARFQRPLCIPSAKPDSWGRHPINNTVIVGPTGSIPSLSLCVRTLVGPLPFPAAAPDALAAVVVVYSLSSARVCAASLLLHTLTHDASTAAACACAATARSLAQSRHRCCRVHPRRFC